MTSKLYEVNDINNSNVIIFVIHCIHSPQWICRLHAAGLANIGLQAKEIMPDLFGRIDVRLLWKAKITNLVDNDWLINLIVSHSEL